MFSLPGQCSVLERSEETGLEPGFSGVLNGVRDDSFVHAREYSMEQVNRSGKSAAEERGRWKRSAEDSSSANRRKDGQLIAFGRNLVQFAVAGIDHGHADFVEWQVKETDDVLDRGPIGELHALLLEAVVPEIGKQFDRELH
jgi:hypothetical protein